MNLNLSIKRKSRNLMADSLCYSFRAIKMGSIPNATAAPISSLVCWLVGWITLNPSDPRNWNRPPVREDEWFGNLKIKKALGSHFSFTFSVRGDVRTFPQVN